jgi:hypothetical protein
LGQSEGAWATEGWALAFNCGTHCLYCLVHRHLEPPVSILPKRTTKNKFTVRGHFCLINKRGNCIGGSYTNLYFGCNFIHELAKRVRAAQKLAFRVQFHTKMFTGRHLALPRWKKGRAQRMYISQITPCSSFILRSCFNQSVVDQARGESVTLAAAAAIEAAIEAAILAEVATAAPVA